MDKDLVNCMQCKKPEPDPKNMITCMYCFSSFHFECKDIYGKAKHKIKRDKYFCAVKCAELFKRITEMSSNKSSMLSMVNAEIQNFVSQVVSEMNCVKSEVKTVCMAIDESQEFLASKFDRIVTEFNALKAENEDLKQQIDQLKKSQTTLQSTVQEVERGMNCADMEIISNNVMFFGLPSTSGENVPELIKSTVGKIGVNLSTRSLVSATRLFKPNKPNTLVPIRAVFRSKSDKELILNKKREFGPMLSTLINESFLIDGKPSVIVIRDELTPPMIDLLKKIRAMQKQLNVKFIWPGRNGYINIKKDENSELNVIKNLNDFEALIKTFG